MQSLSVSKFKATCLAIIDRIQKTGESVLITKHGKPAAMISPPPSECAKRKTEAGMFKDRIKVLGDIVTPLDPEDWEISDHPI